MPILTDMGLIAKAIVPGCLVAALFWSGCAGSVRVRETVAVPAPPPERVEVVTAAPSPDHVWVKGHWQWVANGNYAWVPGHWAVRPHPYAIWVPGHWKARPQGWVWIDGHWRG